MHVWGRLNERDVGRKNSGDVRGRGILFPSSSPVKKKMVRPFMPMDNAQSFFERKIDVLLPVLRNSVNPGKFRLYKIYSTVHFLWANSVESG